MAQQPQQALAQSQPQPVRGRPLPDARRMKIWLSVSAALIIAALVMYLTLGQRPAQQPSAPQARQGAASVPLSSLLSMAGVRGAGDYNVSYSGVLRLSNVLNSNFTVPFTLTQQRSAAGDAAILSYGLTTLNSSSHKTFINNMTLELYRYGASSYYYCLSYIGLTQCYNETANAANASAGLMGNVEIFNYLRGIESYQVPASQVSYNSTRNGTVCDYFSATVNGSARMSGCVDGATGLIAQLSAGIHSAGTNVSYSYAISLSAAGGHRSPLPESEVVSRASAPAPRSTDSRILAYLAELAFGQPMSYESLTTVTIAAAQEAGAVMLPGWGLG